jgi:HSP20 family protein
MNRRTDMNTVTEKRETAKTPADEGRLMPPVDVVEDATGITLYADLPGVPKDRVQVRIDGEQLTLEGEMAIPLPEGLTPTHVEVQRARYHRAFTLSRELDADQMSAEMSQGVLRLRIPKAAHAQPRRVEVKVA